MKLRFVLIGLLLVLFSTQVYADITPPVTTFSSFQVPNTTDQNITLTCTDNDSGCKTINYNINNEGWNTIHEILTGQIDDKATNTQAGSYSTNANDFTTVKTYDLNSYGSGKTLGGFDHRLITAPSTTVYARLKYNYSDATSDYSNTTTHNTNSWSAIKEFTTLSNPLKNLDNIELQLYTSNSNSGTIQFWYNNYKLDYNYGSAIVPSGSFIYSGSGDHNIQYFSTDNSDNNETIKTSYFTTYGAGRFYFKDENSGSDLTGVQVNFNGTDYDSGANNYIDFNFQEITTDNYLFTFTKTGYETRYYKIDLNKFTDLNINFMMIPEMENVGNVRLTVYDADGLTTVPNNYVTVKKEGYVVGRLKTDPYANVSFVLNEVDTNYTFQIEGKYDTNMGNVLILRPKKEKQPQPEITDDWTITLTTSNAETQYDINTNSKAILIIPNRSTYYYAKVDTNSGEYYARTYTLAVRGDRDGLTYTVQPYLIHEDDDSSSFKITLKERYTGRKIPRGLIKIYTTETGNTQIATILTDDSAEIDIYLLKNTTYWISAEDSLGTQLLFYGNTRTMRNTIFGQDILLMCDYTINRGGITQISIYPIQKVVDINTTVAISIDAIWNNVSWWNPETNQIEIKAINNSDIDILVYKDGIYNESLGLLNGTLDTNNNLGYNLTHTFVLNEYGKDYNILVYVDGTLTKQFYIETITLAKRNEIYGLAGTETIIQWLAIAIIITLAIIIGAITGYGLETLFLLSIIMVLAGIGTIQIIIVAMMGVIYFLMPFIRDYFKE